MNFLGDVYLAGVVELVVVFCELVGDILLPFELLLKFELGVYA